MATVTCCAAWPSVTLTRPSPSPSTSSRPATEMCHSRRRLGSVVLIGCVVAVLARRRLADQNDLDAELGRP